MEYDQFFGKQEISCDCSTIAGGLVALLVSAYMLVDCMCMCKQRQRIYSLNHENQTLKGIILQSVDQALTQMLKNGNEFEKVHAD